MAGGGDQHGKGTKGAKNRTKEDWVVAATRALLDLLEQELVLAPPEILARLHESGWQLAPGQKPTHFDPHIITEAQHRLVRLGACEERSHSTRGGRTVSLLVTAQSLGRTTAINKSLSRKALLYVRYLSIARTAGEAGEFVVREALKTARSGGVAYTPAVANFGEVSEMLGVSLRGSLDSGVWLHWDVEGIPQQPIGIPIEVKNRRLVLYPTHKEVHQLLSKAAHLQISNPDYPIAPLLICRRAHQRLFWMASDLGFRVWQTKKQFVFTTKDNDERKIAEVVRELGLADLTVVDRKSPPGIIQIFQEILPGSGRGSAKQAANVWKWNAQYVAPFASRLRTDDVDPADRQEEISELHAAVGGESSWAFREEVEIDDIPEHEE